MMELKIIVYRDARNVKKSTIGEENRLGDELEVLSIAKKIKDFANKLSDDISSNKSRKYYADQINILTDSLISKINGSGNYDPEKLDPTRQSYIKLKPNCRICGKIQINPGYDFSKEPCDSCGYL